MMKNQIKWKFERLRGEEHHYSQNLLAFFFKEALFSTLNKEFIEKKVYFAIYLCAFLTHTITFSNRKEVHDGN